MKKNKLILCSLLLGSFACNSIVQSKPVSEVSKYLKAQKYDSEFKTLNVGSISDAKLDGEKAKFDGIIKTLEANPGWASGTAGATYRNALRVLKTKQKQLADKIDQIEKKKELTDLLGKLKAKKTFTYDDLDLTLNMLQDEALAHAVKGGDVLKLVEGRIDTAIKTEKTKYAIYSAFAKSLVDQIDAEFDRIGNALKQKEVKIKLEPEELTVIMKNREVNYFTNLVRSTKLKNINASLEGKLNKLNFVNLDKNNKKDTTLLDQNSALYKAAVYKRYEYCMKGLNAVKAKLSDFESKKGNDAINWLKGEYKTTIGEDAPAVSEKLDLK